MLRSTHTMIIAEAGVNHNGDRDMAFELIDAAADAGADAVKFQTFQTEALVTEYAPKARYQRSTTGANGSQFELLKKLELSRELHYELAQYCHRREINFLSTPFDRISLRFLVGEMKLGALKISSGDLTNGPLLLDAAYSECDVILSTGMSTIDEIKEALSVLAFGFTENRHAKPSLETLHKAFVSPNGYTALRSKVALLHCTTEYPTPPSDVNLSAMHTMREHFGLTVGLSDHTNGITVPIAAVACGAKIIEKHFTLDRNLPGPDHKASLEPDEFKRMVSEIRIVEEAFGNGIKEPQVGELENIPVVRKSIVAAVDIAEGELFTEENLDVKRPGTGISPMCYWDLLGTSATRAYKAYDLIEV